MHHRMLGLVLLVACSGGPADTDPSEADTDTDTDTDADTDADTDTDTDADSDTDTDTDTDVDVQATAGTWCDAGTRIARVTLDGGWSSPPTVYAQVWDRPDPSLAPATVSDGTCSYHAWDSSLCALVDCVPGTTCGVDPVSGDAACVPERNPVTGIALTLTDGTSPQILDTPNGDGALEGSLAAALVGQAVSMELTWPGVRVTSPALSLPTGDLLPATATLQSGDSCAPGDVTVTWTDGGQGAMVHSLTNNNHHLPQDRFTDCWAPTSTGSFVIPAAMMDPLSGSTCLEFQALTHLQVASADIGAGCVELVWSGPQVFASQQ